MYQFRRSEPFDTASEDLPPFEMFCRNIENEKNMTILQAFQIESDPKKSDKSSLKYSCCIPNREVKDFDSTYRLALSSKTQENAKFPMKKWLPKHHANCKDGRKELMYGINHEIKYHPKRAKNFWLDYDAYHQSLLTTSCVPLNKTFITECVTMHSTWTEEGTRMSLFNGVSVDCKNGVKESGKKVGAEGKRSFLNRVIFKKEARQYRYIYDCCRIKA